MNIPCVIDHPPTCFDGPIANLSSEAPDYRRYLDIYYSQNGCVGMCWSNTSWWEAFLCAQAQAALCEGWTDTNEVPVTCTVLCPEGGSFSYTIAAGVIYGATPADAAERAYTLCCQQATAYRICCPALEMQTCVGETSSWTITPTGTISEAISWELVAGSLPPGISLVPGTTSLGVSGTPTAAGRYTFTVRGLTTVSTYTEREYTIDVYEITTDTFANAVFGYSYSAVCAADGPVAGTWGALNLPAGLTIDPTTGIIGGTPTELGTFAVTLLYFIP